MMGIKSPVKAFYFDRGIWFFGNTVEGAMNAAESKAKTATSAKAARSRVLHAHLSDGSTKGRFKDPGAVNPNAKKAVPEQMTLGGDWFSG